MAENARLLNNNKRKYLWGEGDVLRTGPPTIVTGATISVGSSERFDWLRNEAFLIRLRIYEEGYEVRLPISLLNSSLSICQCPLERYLRACAGG